MRTNTSDQRRAGSPSSLIETFHSEDERAFKVTARINDRDLQLGPVQDVIWAVKHDLVRAITDHLMERITPHLDKVLKEVLTAHNAEMSKENEQLGRADTVVTSEPAKHANIPH